MVVFLNKFLTMRKIIALIILLASVLSACGSRSNQEFEKLTPEQKEDYATNKKQKYIHSLCLLYTSPSPRDES
jgi:hypothetical protein